MAAGKTVEITRGLARNEKEERRLRAAGVTKPIYRLDKGEHPGRFKMRKGESLGVVEGLRVFGDARRDIIWAVKLIHSWGAAVVDVETGLRSDKDGAEMVIDALAPVRPSAEYKRMQEAAVKSRVKGRMTKEEALKIWRNPNLSTKEAVSLMTKWSQATAYKQLGSRLVVPGRRPTNRQHIPVLKPEDIDPNLVPPSRRWRRGTVYFVLSGKSRVKIGFAKDVQSRVRDLQVAHHTELKLLHTVEGTVRTEAEFHERFREYRVNGEWFRLAGALKKFLSKVKSK